MSKVEVLLATMNRSSTDFICDMNVTSDIVIANQADGFAVSCEIKSDCAVKMITTPYRGVGKNRNTALAYASNDIIMFADDDMQYVNGYQETVEAAFEKYPKADLIVFEVDESGRESKQKKTHKAARVSLTNFARYGTFRVAMRRSAVAKNRLAFSEHFGGGTIYGSGEDTLFLRDALRRKLKIITVPTVIAKVDQSRSTWFTGYDEKFMFDKGALCKALFPMFYWLFGMYFAIKFSKKSDMGILHCFSLMMSGSRAYRTLTPYKNWKNING